MNVRHVIVMFRFEFCHRSIPKLSKTSAKVPLAEQTSHTTPITTEIVADAHCKIHGSLGESDRDEDVHAPYVPATTPIVSVAPRQKLPR